MPATSELRAAIENNRMMQLYRPAIAETLNILDDGEAVVDYGFANVGNCDGYYLITDRGIHYCDRERAGLLKKTYVSRFFAKSTIASGVIDEMGPPGSAYLRIFDDRKKMVLVMWFQDELGDAPARAQAEAAARALGAV